MSFVPTGVPGARPRTAWADRVRVLGDASGVDTAQLAALLEAEQARSAQTLFTVTPAEELDEISRWARLADAAWCGQVRAVVAAYNRASRTDREFLSCEVALGLNLTDSAAQDLVATALLAASLPGLVDSVETGRLTVRHVYAVLGALDGCGLGADEQAAVVLVALARYHGHTPAQLGALVRKLVLTVDQVAASVREADKTANRRVRFRAVEDGQGLLTARGPLAMIEAIRASLEHTLPLTVEPGDTRNRDAREFDLLTDLLTGGWLGGNGGDGSGGWDAVIVIPHDVATTTETQPETEAPTEAATEPDRAPERQLAEIPGLGPVLPDTAREILAHARTVTRLLIDPTTGEVLDVTAPLPGPAARATDTDPHTWLRQLERLPVRGLPSSTSSYRPSPRLRRFVTARDRCCVFPGCTRPAIRCDLDHRTAWPHGPTSPENLHALCRRHHRAKQAVFTVLRLPDGTTRWIHRGGWYFDRPPERY